MPASVRFRGMKRTEGGLLSRLIVQRFSGAQRWRAAGVEPDSHPDGREQWAAPADPQPVLPRNLGPNVTDHLPFERFKFATPPTVDDERHVIRCGFAIKRNPHLGGSTQQLAHELLYRVMGKREVGKPHLVAMQRRLHPAPVNQTANRRLVSCRFSSVRLRRIHPLEQRVGMQGRPRRVRPLPL